MLNKEIFPMFRKPLLLLSLLMLVFPHILLAQGPKIVFENPDVTFDPVYQGEKVVQVFHFSNQGGEPLLIEQVKSSCGCTAALVSSREIPPGGSGEVSATFDSTRFRGNVAKTVYVYTNDPMQKVTQLHLRGTVKQEFELSENRLVIGPLAVGGEGEATLVVTSRSTEPLLIKDVRTTLREVTASLPQQELAPGSEVSIQVKVKLAPESRDVNGYLLIATNSSRLPDIRVPLLVKVLPAQ